MPAQHILHTVIELESSSTYKFSDFLGYCAETTFEFQYTLKLKVKFEKDVGHGKGPRWSEVLTFALLSF
jgi:hypothetical protein